MRRQLHFKNCVFIKLPLPFDLEKSAHAEKNNRISQKYVQIKGNTGQNTLLDFTDVKHLKLI